MIGVKITNKIKLYWNKRNYKLFKNIWFIIEIKIGIDWDIQDIKRKFWLRKKNNKEREDQKKWWIYKIDESNKS